jgi:hypothetical protein
MFFGFRKSSFGRRRSGGVGHKVVTKDSSIPEKPTHHITVAPIFCNHLAKLLQKKVASQKNQHIPENQHITENQRITCCYYSFCNHLAKLLQKNIASQKNQHITSIVASKKVALSRLGLNAYENVDKML